MDDNLYITLVPAGINFHDGFDDDEYGDDFWDTNEDDTSKFEHIQYTPNPNMRAVFENYHHALENHGNMQLGYFKKDQRGHNRLMSPGAQNITSHFIEMLVKGSGQRNNEAEDDNAIESTTPRREDVMGDVDHKMMGKMLMRDGYHDTRRNKHAMNIPDVKIPGAKSQNKKTCQFIYDSIIGKDVILDGPFGPRRGVYCDFVASGKPLQFIEQYITECVLPKYANTHSESTTMATQMSRYREDAREIIKKYVNGNENDKVIFTGSGSTAAIAKMITVLEKSPSWDLRNTIVFVTAYEHHSNILSWENAKVLGVVRLKLNKDGTLNMTLLREHCKIVRDNGNLIIGSISAASNVTGIITETDRAAEILHDFGGLAFFDFACGAPYMEMNMNPSPKARKDAIFISTHKFVGGPQSPGILVAKADLFQNSIPGTPGGGTVDFVSREIVVYSDDPITKEEGGTPDIVGAIRAGLTFKLRSVISHKYIEDKEKQLVSLFFRSFDNHPNMMILGSKTAERLAIFTFVVKHPPSGLLIHHVFISVLLNDLFGIQSRPGCACAGPYSMDLLDISEEKAKRIVKYFMKRRGQRPMSMLKAGFVRFNLPYFYPESEIYFILNAVRFVIENAIYFLPLYTYNTESGFWKHRYYDRKLDNLKNISFKDRSMDVKLQKVKGETPKDVFAEAEKHLKYAKSIMKQVGFDDDPPVSLEPDDKDLRWFLLPHEAQYFTLNER